MLLNAQTKQQTVLHTKTDSLRIDSTSIIQNKAMVYFDHTSYNLGQILKDSKLTQKYLFTNIGSAPLFISNVRASCSCTVASYPKQPILPDDTNKIIVKLDTKHLGKFNKTIAVYSNASNNYAEDIGCSRILLKIRWEVVDKIEPNTD